MANSSILCFKRAKSIDSNAFQDEFVENDKINILEANLHLLKKIFCCHSWEKKGGNLITIPEFFKIMMNLKITPKLMKTYTIKEIVNAVVKSKEVINTIKGIYLPLIFVIKIFRFARYPRINIVLHCSYDT